MIYKNVFIQKTRAAFAARCHLPLFHSLYSFFTTHLQHICYLHDCVALFMHVTDDVIGRVFPFPAMYTAFQSPLLFMKENLCSDLNIATIPSSFCPYSLKA